MNDICPKCGSELERSRRNRLDKIISLFSNSERYRCDRYNYGCDFTVLKRVNPKKNDK